MDHREKLLNIVNEKGPLLPAQINKELHTNVLFASAMLSEMVDNKKLRLTNLKVGGSPLYFSEGQEKQLENFMNKLAPAEFAAADLLKRSRILRDKDQEAEVRVALREVKDFAVPLEVTVDGHTDLFWKYYLISDDDAKILIADFMNAKKLAEKVEQKSEPKVSEQKELTPETKHDDKKLPLTVQVPTQDVSYASAVSFSTLVDSDGKVDIEEESVSGLVLPEDDEFFSKVKSLLDESGVRILEVDAIKKGSEYDIVMSLPSPLGAISCFCKAKSKAKFSDQDLSLAFAGGQLRHLPVICLVTGELTKSAQKILEKEFKGVLVKKI